MPHTALLVLCTCPDHATANRIAERLVEDRLAACVNLLPQVTSLYRWQGQVERADERLLLIKTAAARYPELEQAIRAQHPYELPEIVAVPIERGLPAYLDWIESCSTRA